MRYVVEFGYGKTGLTPTFSIVMRLDTLAYVPGPYPAITEIPDTGAYTFEYTPTTDVYFVLDGGAAAGEGAARYKTGVLQPADSYPDDQLSIMRRVISLLGANTVRDDEALDGQKRTIAARIRSYDTAANAQAAGLTGLLATYTLQASYAVDGACTMTITEVLP